MAKSNRRGHNEGSVYYDASRDRWVAAITIETGRRKKFYCKSQREAIEKRNEALRELKQGMLATGPQQKLGPYIENWLEEVHKPTVRISTYVKYKKLVHSYIVPELGNVWLQKLTPQHIQSCYTRLARKGLSPKTINSVHGVLHLALENAVRWNLIARNVCELATPPRVVRPEIQPLSVEQARKLLEAAQEHRLKVLLTLAVVTAMRRGEIVGLRWSDIDFDRKYLSVLRTVDYIPHYGYVENAPKTKAGKRRIRLPAFLLELLQQHRDQQMKHRQEVGDKWEDRDLVFPDLHGGYFNPGYLDKVFAKLLKDAGIPHMRLHDLRHSAATILLSLGVNVKVIQELLGHSDIVITLGTYGHLLPSMQQEVVDTWDEVFGDEDGDEGD